MSRTKPVGLRSEPVPGRIDPRRELWAYDAGLSILLAEVIRDVEQTAPERWPAWWASCERDLRVHAVVSDLYLDLDLGLDAGQREELAQLFEAAAGRLLARPPVTAEEAAGWVVLDDLPVIFRGGEPVDPRPVAELGRALADLIRGTLPTPPPNTWWFFGSPEGRSTIGMRTGVDIRPPEDVER